MDNISSGSFEEEIIQGLSTQPKYLLSKYFYDKKGDALFQKIMHCEDYYLTRCEKEILTEQKGEIVQEMSAQLSEFDVIELGAGDCYKSVTLLKEIEQQKGTYTFFPIDISSSMTTFLQEYLPRQLTSVRIESLNGGYLEMLEEADKRSAKPKLILFLGSSMGNMSPEGSISFLQSLHERMNPDDLLLIGCDLKKDPQLILNAYNDRDGYTRAFNLNLLERINKDLNADFDLESFTHFPVYDPENGLCRSFLVSKKKQEIRLGKKGTVIPFERDETIAMERSQKYTISGLQKTATKAGFTVIDHFFDSKKWFVDGLWKAN